MLCVRGGMSGVFSESAGGITTVTLARAKARNAFDAEMIAELERIFRGLPKGTAAVVVRGEGPVFCAGADLAWMQRSIAQTEEQNLAEARALAAMLGAVDEAPCLVIACVKGAALGGGAGFLCCCDVVLAEEGARFGFTEVRLGLVPAVISPFVIRRIGAPRARRYFMTGEIFAAEVAARIGLIDQVVAAGGLEEEVRRQCQLAQLAGPEARVRAKELVYEVGSLAGEELLTHTTETIAHLRVQPEAQAGMRAFLERREPPWCSPLSDRRDDGDDERPSI